MERLALIGVSHRRGGAQALESWQDYFTPARLAGLNQQGFREWVPIITCNRWDLAVVVPDGMTLDKARAELTPAHETTRPYAYVGDGALEQITRIAASLDSLNPGEDQIMAQVREAFAQAKACESTGPITSFTFHTALRIAKKVRRDVALAPMNTSLFSLARPHLEATLQQRGIHAPRIGVIGAGDMGTLAAKTLASQANVTLTIINRNVDRARQLAKHLNVQHLSLQDFLNAPPAFDALVCCTPVANLINPAVLNAMPDLQALIDMGVPRNVDANAATQKNLMVLDVDSLQTAGQQRRNALSDKLAQAEQIIQTELELALTEWTERQLGPSILKLRSWYLETIGTSLPEDEAMRLAHKFAHVPIKGLRALAREYGLDAAKVFLAETGLAER